MTQNLVAIASCPNCSSDAISVESRYDFSFVHCGNCLMRGPKNFYSRRAIQLWNNLPRKKSCCKQSYKPTQQIVFESIKERGYFDQGLSLKETLARQIAKLAEELSELAEESRNLPREIYHLLSLYKLVAKEIFDDKDIWKNSELFYGPKTANKLADIGIVLFCMAEIVNQSLQDNVGASFDLLDAISKKVQQDIERGIRNG